MSAPALQASSVQAPRFKVVIVGSGGTGKTTFVKRHRTGEFEKKYVATQGVDVNPLPFYTSMGQVVFNVWDTAGQERYSGLQDGYYIGAQAGIVFFDLTSQVSFKESGYYCRELLGGSQHVAANLPLVIVGSKVDCNDRKVQPSEIAIWLANLRIKYPGRTIQYYDVSAKSNYNLEKPFLFLARLLVCRDLNFVEAPAVLPPEAVVTQAQLAQWSAEWSDSGEEVDEESESDSPVAQWSAPPVAQQTWENRFQIPLPPIVPVQKPADNPILDEDGECFLQFDEPMAWKDTNTCHPSGVVSRNHVIVLVTLCEQYIRIESTYLPTRYRGRVEDESHYFTYADHSQDAGVKLVLENGRYRWTAPISLDDLVEEVDRHLRCIYC
jgi:GTP-binding nuclear protein Ran